jgi:hypothetical protein
VYCKNPVCGRIGYQLRFSGSIIRTWMKAKEDTDYWKTHRTSLMMIYGTCKSSLQYSSSSKTETIYLVTNFHKCSRCDLNTIYCSSKACKQIDWIGSHKKECDNYIRDH